MEYRLWVMILSIKYSGNLLAIPVCDVLKRCEHHWCGLDTNEADRGFGYRCRVAHSYS